MLLTEFTPKGFKFSVIQNNVSLHFKEWDASSDCIYYMPLSNLVDNGLAEYDKSGCYVPFDSIYFLDPYDLQVLGFPKIYDKFIRIRSIGLLNDSEFSYSIDFLSHIPDGEILSDEIIGNIVKYSNGEFRLLTETQYKTIKEIDRFNEVPSEYKTTEFNLREFGKIKELAYSAGIVMDEYLENENVFIPEKISLEIDRDGDTLVISPTVNIKEKEKFKNIFQRQRKVLDVYPISDSEGKRTRVVLDPVQKDNLKPIKEHKCRYDDIEERKQIIENPTEFFDPDQFDLSVFYSERVIDLGFYKPKFYPFVSPYKSAWIVEAHIEHPLNGTSTIKFEDQEEIDELNKCIESAQKEAKSTVEYKDTKLDLEDAKLLSEMAQKQLDNPNKKTKIETDDKGQRKVLIIEENAEDTGYRTGNQNLSKEKEYKLYRNSNLIDYCNLKEHQEEGVAWLQYLMINKAPGCLLADDMGLGKTLQLLYFIDWHAQNNLDHKPYLIVAPISLLENWENEYNRFFKDKMDITILSSSQVPRKFNREIIDRMNKCDIILTNYETIRNSQLNFCAVDFDIIVLDEAQKVKSPGTLVTNAVKALKGKFKVAMTGTPVENTLLDLWCIMDFCVPGLLGNAKEFAKKYQNPLKSSDVDLISLGNEIHSRLGIYFLRRLKRDAAKDLPEKLIIKKGIDMPTVQEDKYKGVINDYHYGVQPNMLATIQGIRSVSEHPYLYDGTLDSHEINILINDAARLQATIDFIEDIKIKDEKVILFAERKDTQRMLQRIVREKYGFTPKIINGDTPTNDLSSYNGKQSRQKAIDEFQSKMGFGVIIMSPIAAGMGLNVTAANHVIHYSRHWNPAKENQATDRAYRIGQAKDVYVYYPMATNKNFQSFDITLDQLLERKNNVANSTIFPTERVEVRPEDFENLLNI